MRLDDDAAAVVGQWVAEARWKLHGWRHNELAAAAKISNGTLSNIEQGKQGKRGWNQSTLFAIEKALQVPKGTLRRVADGEEVDPQTVQQTDSAGQLVDEIRRLADLLENLADRVAALENDAQER